jgi:hypothetical protein
MDATQAAEERIMGTILRRLSSQSLIQRLVRAHATGRPVPALDRTASRIIATMRAAARLAVERTEGLELTDVKHALDWRIGKVRSLVKVIKTQDSPALGSLLALARQPGLFGSDLTGKVSDALVTAHTAEQQAACGPKEVLIWEPERDACVRCLKYAGQYRSATGEFKAGQSFDPQAPRPEGTLPGPPLHPKCRCNLAVIPKSSADSNAQALQREAQRSILKGWALESESDAARVRAAQALLNSNVIAPKSVLAETRRRLKSGVPFTRDVP